MAGAEVPVALGRQSQRAGAAASRHGHVAGAGGAADPVSLAEELRLVGGSAGLDLVRIAAATPFEGTRRHLEERKAAGLNGGMAFTYRRPERSTDPGNALPGARALVVGALSYDRPGPDRRSGSDLGSDLMVPRGRVARSAVRDEYAVLRRALGAVAEVLRAAGFRARVVADDNALVDRAAAHRAGIGWWGKNTLVIVPGVGSWFVLGSVITDAPLVPDDAPVADHCGRCSRCLPACPTGALVAPGVLDARRCLAWLLEAPGPIPTELRGAVGDRIYGCDECQVVCPPNKATALRRRRLAADPDPAGVSAAGDPAGAMLAREARLEAERPGLARIVLSSDEELLRRFGHFYLAGRDPVLLRRNALVALGNVARGDEPGVVEALVASLASPNALVRAHAVWATAALGRHDLLRDVHAGETDPDVLAELAAASERTSS